MTTEQLPNAERCHVEEKKIRDYLLNQQHVYGRSKANFLLPEVLQQMHGSILQGP